MGPQLPVGNSPFECIVLPAYKCFSLLYGPGGLKPGWALLAVLVVVQQHKSDSASGCREGRIFYHHVE